MILSMREQGLIFAFICLLGFGFGFLYDLLRILREAFGTLRPLSMAEDFIYWVFAAFAVFYFLLGVNYGDIRLYMVLDFIGGMVLYYLTLSPSVVGISVFAVRKVKAAVLWVLKPVFIIVNIIKLWLKKREMWVIIRIRPMAKKVKNVKKLFALRGRLKRKKKRIKKGKIPKKQMNRKKEP
ncbi:MAG: spore cortex biosynthesis protein YabQ [Clostridiales bacterium]|nr:spore cortex biosynthesis protein YabQ [Clostridiales bacterium]